MVLLEIHTDCQTSSEVAKECPESHEDSQGKGRRKNKHSVCIYIWLRGRGGQGKEVFLFELLPSPSPPICIASPPDGRLRLLALLYIALLYTLMDLHFPCSSTTVCIYDMDAT